MYWMGGRVVYLPSIAYATDDLYTARMLGDRSCRPTGRSYAVA